MSTRKTTLFYTVLVAIASLAVGMVIASRLDLSPASSAQMTATSGPAVNRAPLDGPIDALTFRRIAQAQSPTVVNIRTESAPRGAQLTQVFPDDLLERFFGRGERPQPPPADAPPQQATGTGFVIDREGFVLTNNHVVEGADQIFVKPYGAGRTEEYEAELVGRDVLTDSALIRLKEKPSEALGVVKFGDSDEMQPGDWVMAIGNPFGLGHTVTVGVISALGRPFGIQGREQDMLQTDAAINPGNSGGPLLNIRGEVVGINTSIISDQRQANLGIGFAMPINLIRDILPQLRRGKVIRGVIGVQISREPISPRAADQLGLPNTNGAVVTTVNEDGPAGKGGMQAGDVVVEYDGKRVANSSALVDMVVHTQPGRTVPVVVMRNKERSTLRITVDELNLEAEQGRAPGSSPREEPTETGLGMELRALTPEIARQLRVPSGRGGAVVSRVERRSPAFNAGIANGDVILKVNNQTVTSLAQVTRELQRAPSGDVVFLLVWRGGQEVFITVNKP